MKNAQNTRASIREAERLRVKLYNDYISRFTSYLHNSIEIDGLGDTPKRYFLKLLFTRGRIVYDKETELFLKDTPIGLDIYGLPIQYQLFGYDGFNVMRYASEVVVLRANDIMYPIIEYIRTQAEKIVDIDMAIRQNLDACQTMSIAEFENQTALLSLINIEYARKVGATICYVNKNNGFDKKPLNVQSTGATYLVDKLMQQRSEIIDETLNVLGIPTSNTDKRERVQTMEVNANLGFALNCIKTLVNTLNYDAKQGNLKIIAKINTSIKEILKNENEENKPLDEGGENNQDDN